MGNDRESASSWRSRLARHGMWLAVALNLAIRLPLIDWYASPFSDALFMIEQDPIGEVPRLPLYPLLLQGVAWLIGGDGLFAGRLVSIVAGAATVVPVWRTGKLLYGRRGAWAAAALWTLSPLPFRWSLRVMTDGLYALALAAALWCICELIVSPKGRWLGGATLSLGLSCLIRPEGVLMLPLILAAHVYALYRARTLRVTLGALWGWLGPLVWLGWRVFLFEGGGYGRTLSRNLARLDPEKLGALAAFFGSYQVMLLLLMTPPACLLLLVAASDLASGGRDPEMDRRRSAWAWFAGYTLAVTFGLVVIHFFFSTRHLVATFPVLCVVAGGGAAVLWRRRRWAAAALLSLSLLWSAATVAMGLYATRDTFGSMRRASEAARADGYEGWILTNNYDARLTAFYAGGEVWLYRRHRVRPGRRVHLNSFEWSPRRVRLEEGWICNRFECTVIARESGRVMPLFADDLSLIRRYNGNQGHIMNNLFNWFDYQTVVIEVGPRLKQARGEARRRAAPEVPRRR